MPTHTDLIHRYEQGATAPARALDNLSPHHLTAFPIPNTWSIQQVILHLMDSDLIASERMKRTIAMDRPLILAYDETLFTQRLHYHQLDPHAAAALFKLNRTMTAALLRALPPDAWSRTLIHSERGLETLEHLVRGYCDHLDHHLAFIAAKRRALGV
jgi:uncharacterized damage-inducible protein DinB